MVCSVLLSAFLIPRVAMAFAMAFAQWRQLDLSQKPLGIILDEKRQQVSSIRFTTNFFTFSVFLSAWTN